MPTGYEVQMYRDIGRIADALEKLANPKPLKRRVPSATVQVSAVRTTSRFEVQEAFVQALRDRGADLAADRLSLLDPDAAWAAWFGPLVDELEDLVKPKKGASDG